MTGKERFLTALRRGIPDRVPVFLRDLTLGLDLCDFTTPEVSAVYDSAKATRAVLASQERFQQDCVVGCIHDLGLDVECLGGEVAYPERGVPRVSKPPLAGLSMQEVPEDVDPSVTGRWPAVIKTYRQVKAQLGDRACVAANIEGPVTRAGVLRGLDNLAMDLAADRPTAARIIDLSVRMAVHHVRALVAAGVDVVFIAAATDGPAVISPTDYLEFTIPGLREIVAAADSLNTPVIFHPHGAFTDPRYHYLVEAAIDCGIAGFQLSEGCDLALAKRLWSDRVCILGGPDVPEVLFPGPPERVREKTREDLEAAMDRGGFIIMASCSLHRGAPLEHLDAMIQAVHDYGVYD